MESTLADIVVNTDRVVVIDTETTGVYPRDRVLEIAVVTLDLSGQVIDEWETLVNPRRDVGPSWLHGITPSMLAGAPAFADVAGPLAARLQGAVLAAHNLAFDTRMLVAEYAGLGVDVDFSSGLDTLRATRCKLHLACEQYDIPLNGAHRALNDARATAKLLVRLVEKFPTAAQPSCLHGTVPPSSPDRRFPRQGRVDTVTGSPSWFAGLAANLAHDASDMRIADYLEVLDIAMADLHFDEREQSEFGSLARGLGLNSKQIERAHQQWLDDFIRQACADTVVDNEEYDQLCQAAAVLKTDKSYIDDRVAKYRTQTIPISLKNGTVCFTGSAINSKGEQIPRSEMEAHARKIGLMPVESVTKTRCDLLVAVDPASHSGKTDRAVKYSIPIVSVADFLAATSITLLCGQVSAGSLSLFVCATCKRSWSRPQTRGHKPAQCPECLTSMRKKPSQ